MILGNQKNGRGKDIQVTPYARPFMPAAAFDSYISHPELTPLFNCAFFEIKTQYRYVRFITYQWLHSCVVPPVRVSASLSRYEESVKPLGAAI
jgi:hypothetical protein